MLPAQYRMRRSSDFSATVKHGTRAVQPDIVLHARQAGDEPGPRVGLVVAKAVGSAVDRHRVARRLRHVCRTVLPELRPTDHLVIRARPSSRHAVSARLEQQLRAGLRRIHQAEGCDR
ncbi:ribonuclease P protein component [Mycobacterium talmoniae]|uniref:Ribonuclease P protein component n=1 Tax=Mycobacterium talmoniae TaxID=1858794 RepID=A0A1S1NDK1_9MYCO|nr:MULTISPECIES: ribonuclease P protein component [Mycobacterium]OHU98860.1 ribonuclease P protein component [Mycobacterium talmoniae]PQM45937.1 Ribonuclease P protein component [Mycobacterium talmoniae]TDH54742.1 ribonuclease P protein component [Mycobacterium eburneum]